MSNSKRAIVVPVLTLAVCAIAMVGLGFALTSSVTSDTNAVEELMIDMANSESYFSTNSVAPGSDNVNELLKIGLGNDKTGTSPGFKVDGGYAYMMIYGNVTSPSLTVSVADTVSGGRSLTTIGSITLSLFNSSDFGVENKEAIASTSSIKNANEVAFVTSSNIVCDSVYVVAVTEINGHSITYERTTVDGNTTITGVWSGNTVTAIPNGVSLNYVFKATTPSS